MGLRPGAEEASPPPAMMLQILAKERWGVLPAGSRRWVVRQALRLHWHLAAVESGPASGWGRGDQTVSRRAWASWKER